MEATIATANQAVNGIVTDIKNNFKGFNIDKIVKAGSLGHGTAVPGHYDIDLVIYSRRMDVLQNIDTMFRPWISKLKPFIKQIQGVTVKSRDENFLVQFTYQVPQEMSISVDLLISPHWSDQHEFYKFLRSVRKDDRIKFSVCASKWQKKFFKRQENQVVKEYIRRAKAWRNSEWSDRDPGRPRSYLMSLLVVTAYERSGRSDPPSVTRALKAVVKDKRKDVYWADGPNDFYRRSDYPDLLPSRPRIVDPANPANNVWESGFYPWGKSSVLVSKIDTIDLSTPI